MHSSERRRKWHALLRTSTPAYLFLLPWLIGFVGLTIYPMLSSLYLSMTDFDLLRPPRWNGGENYARILLADPKFQQSVRVTVLFVAVSVPIKLSVALAVAVALNRGTKGLSAYRSAFYLPSLLGASVAIAELWRVLFQGDGLVNQLLAAFAFKGPSWVSTPVFSIWSLIALAVWQFGSPMVIFLAGLRQIPQDLYEAASIDGAGRIRAFLSITIPLLTPVIFFNLLIQTIEGLRSFTPAFIISGGTGGPVGSTLFYSLYLYQEAFSHFRMGYASALAWILLVATAALSGIAFLSSKLWVHYDE